MKTLSLIPLALFVAFAVWWVIPAQGNIAADIHHALALQPLYVNHNRKLWWPPGITKGGGSEGHYICHYDDSGEICLKYEHWIFYADVVADQSNIAVDNKAARSQHLTYSEWRQLYLALDKDYVPLPVKGKR